MPTSKLPSFWKMLLLDIIGFISYFFPVFGEYFDFAWAPFSAYLFWKFFGGKIGAFGAAFSFVEEILPFTDVIPSFSIGWLIKRFFLKDDK